MGEANELFQLRPVSIYISRNYTGREGVTIDLMVPDYATDETIAQIARDYVNSPRGETLEFDDNSDPVTATVDQDYSFSIHDTK